MLSVRALTVGNPELIWTTPTHGYSAPTNSSILYRIFTIGSHSRRTFRFLHSSGAEAIELRAGDFGSIWNNKRRALHA